MPRNFDIPSFYLSSEIAQIKSRRAELDPQKRNLAPTILNLGRLKIKIARHFGFCFGVQNAIEVAYKALEDNPGKRIFLLSEMIHNPHVNHDLESRGVKFLRTTEGEEIVPLESVTTDDIVIVPAFGTTVELFKYFSSRGIDPYKYNTTCPFVEKVWTRSEQLGHKGYSIIVHGKLRHEETKATVSHAQQTSPTLVIRDIEMANLLASYIKGERDFKDFFNDFSGRYSEGFNPERDLERIGVVNQTTMLATETWEIAEILKAAALARFGSSNINHHFADTRDTLCYATSENQRSVTAMLEQAGDLAIIVGGYNSSNTSHLVELCEKQMPAYHIKDSNEIISAEKIRHFSYQSHQVIETEGWLPKNKAAVEILLTAGASCPDSLVDLVLKKLAQLYNLEGELSTQIKSL
jgi:4-hydroxy-3-methylbut-2-enyl diphosphate reductase